MQGVSRLRRRVPELLLLALLLGIRFRRLLGEICIVTLMVVVAFVGIGVRVTSGRHTLVDLGTTGLLFGLAALWVYTKRAAFAGWDKQATEADSTDDGPESKTC